MTSDNQVMSDWEHGLSRVRCRLLLSRLLLRLRLQLPIPQPPQELPLGYTFTPPACCHNHTRINHTCSRLTVRSQRSQRAAAECHWCRQSCGESQQQCCGGVGCRVAGTVCGGGRGRVHERSAREGQSETVYHWIVHAVSTPTAPRPLLPLPPSFLPAPSSLELLAHIC